MAIQDVPAGHDRTRGPSPEAGLSAGSIVLALAVPLLFLHVRYQPGLSVGTGDNAVRLSDLAVLAVAATAFATGLRSGFAPLRAGRAAWLATAALCAWIAVSIVVAAAGDDGYGLGANLVTWAKFVEYAALALAVPLVVRTGRELRLVCAALALWAAVAAAVAAAQFLGAPVFDAWNAGMRQPSFLGHLDFAALAVTALGVAVAGLATGPDWPRQRWLVPLAAAGGGAGLALSATVAGAASFAVAAAVTITAAALRFGLHARRALAATALVAAVGLGVLAFRGGDLDQFLRFVGVKATEEETVGDVQTYSHRTVLVYIGLRIFADNPAVGVGWQGSSEERAYGPYLDDARTRFPDVADEAFPSPQHEWGVQNAYVQALADMGVPGLALWLAPLLCGLWLAWSGARGVDRRLIGGPLVALATILSLLGVWAAQGLVQGAPLNAATWLAIGLAAAFAARAHEPGPAAVPQVPSDAR